MIISKVLNPLREFDEKLKRPVLRLSRFIGVNLVLDGLGDIIDGFLGGVAGILLNGLFLLVPVKEKVWDTVESVPATEGTREAAFFPALQG